MGRTASLILVVDDSVEMTELLREILSGEGFRVAVAANGAVGLRLAANLAPDLVLLDMMMPEVDGLQFLERLPQELHGRRLPPVIALSGFDRFHTLALERGATAFARKPISLGELMSLVDATLARAPVDGALLAKHERAVDAVRVAASEARRAFWTSHLAGDDARRNELERLLDALRKYFRMPKAFINAITADDTARLIAQSSGPPRLPEDVSSLPAAQTYCLDTVLAGESCIVEDAASHPAFADRGVGFYAAGVVRTGDGLPLATLGVVDVIPRKFGAEDLAVLVHFGERIGARFAHGMIPHAEAIVDASGLFDRDAFSLLADCALRRAERDGGEVVIALLDTADEREVPGLHSIKKDFGRARIVAGRYSPTVLALLSSGATADAIAADVERLTVKLRERVAIRDAGQACFVVLPGAAPLLTAHDLEQQAESSMRHVSRARAPRAPR